MMKRFFSILRYAILIWIVIYLLISIIKFVQINYKINEKYGILAQKYTVVGYTNESVIIDHILLILDRTIFPHFNPLYRYGVPDKMSSTIKLRAPFLDKSFYITMKDGKLISDTFYEVLSKDPKFQHLYSDWVKKQVGIDDENVELEFAGNFDIPYIEFDKITSLSDDYREVFENTHNLYAWMCKVKNIKDMNYNNRLEIANYAKYNYLYKMMQLTGIPQDEDKYYAGHIVLSTGNFDKVSDINYEFKYNARLENSELEELSY